MVKHKQNKKVKNAKEKIFNGIKFKSALEVNVYKAFTSAGFAPQYEPQTFTLWKGFKSTTPFYDKDKKSGELMLQSKKMIDIKYTPDFLFFYKNYRIIVEAKGKENDVFYIKKKLFREYLDREGIPTLFFEVYNLKHVTQVINMLNDL